MSISGCKYDQKNYKYWEICMAEDRLINCKRCHTLPAAESKELQTNWLCDPPACFHLVTQGPACTEASHIGSGYAVN